MIPHELSHLGLHPHPEGGWYRETWRSAHLTVIDYLLDAGSYSGWHRVSGSDEVWHHHRGGRIALHVLHPDGRYERIVLGHTQFSAVVPAECWQAAEPLDDRWVLAGCTVAPPFAFERFTMADTSLAEAFPAHADLIRRLIR